MHLKSLLFVSESIIKSSVAKFLNDNLYKMNSFYKNSLISTLTQFTPPLTMAAKNKSSDSHYAVHLITFKNKMVMIPTNVK